MEYINEDTNNTTTLSSTLLTSQRFKVAVALIIAYFIQSSNMFVDLVLSKIPGATENGKTTDKGSWLCAILIILIYFLADIAASSELI